MTDITTMTFIGDWHRVNWQVSCRFSLKAGTLGCEWNSARPPSHERLMKMIKGYREARDQFALDVAARTGYTLVMLEADPEVGACL